MTRCTAICPRAGRVAEWRAQPGNRPQAVQAAARASMRNHVEAMVGFWNAACPRSDYGNNIRQMAWRRGSSAPSPSPASSRPISGRSSAGASAPSAGRRCRATPRISTRPTQEMKQLIPEEPHLHNWLDMARRTDRLSGPAGPHLLDRAGRPAPGRACSTRWWPRGELKAPIVIGRDHLDSGSVASPNRETEAMRDGSDAVSDWPLLNALVNTASGATWVSLHHGGGVGMGFSQHSGDGDRRRWHARGR